jgi:hypothetical protein
LHPCLGNQSNHSKPVLHWMPLLQQDCTPGLETIGIKHNQCCSKIASLPWKPEQSQ